MNLHFKTIQRGEKNTPFPFLSLLINPLTVSSQIQSPNQTTMASLDNKNESSLSQEAGLSGRSHGRGSLWLHRSRGPKLSNTIDMSGWLFKMGTIYTTKLHQEPFLALYPLKSYLVYFFFVTISRSCVLTY